MGSRGGAAVLLAHVVKAAATIGSVFDAGVLARVLKMPDGALGDVLEELRRERVVLPVGDGRLWAAQ